MLKTVIPSNYQNVLRKGGGLKFTCVSLVKKIKKSQLVEGDLELKITEEEKKIMRKI